MKKLLLIPTMLFPYSLGLGLLISHYFLNVFNVNETVSVQVFEGIISLFFVASLVCNIVYMNLSKQSDSYELIRVALFIKMIHIPAYVLVFLFGVGLASIFFITFPILFIFVVFDYFALLTSSMISVFALAKNVKKEGNLSMLILVFQFFFCADIISLFVLWYISKKKTKTITTTL